MPDIRERERQERVTLAELIERRRTEHSESYADIATRAGISKPYIYKLATQPMTAVPRPATITALARGLQTTERAIRYAALVSANLLETSVETADPRVDAIVASLAELDARDLQVVENLVSSLRIREP